MGWYQSPQSISWKELIKNVTREEKCFGKIKKSAVTDTPVNVKHICEERMTMKIEENEWEQIVTIPYNIIMKKKG